MVKYIPDVSLGNILTIVSLLGLGIGAWTSIARDNERQDGQLKTLEAAQIADKKDVNENLKDIKAAVGDLAKQVNNLDKNVAVLSAAGAKK